MKQEAAGTDQQVPAERDEKNPVMSFSTAISNALCPEPDEQEVRNRIDDLGGVWCRIVVLCLSFSAPLHRIINSINLSTTYLFAPIQSRCYRTPIPSLGRRIWDEWEMRPVRHGRGMEHGRLLVVSRKNDIKATTKNNKFGTAQQ